jgi:hypothetical protein
MIAVCRALFEGTDMPIVTQIVIYSATMFVGCMICHGELYRLKPHPRQLTSFYLLIAAGGAVGGLFVALIAPAIFNNYYEMHLSLGCVVLLLLLISWKGGNALSPGRWRFLFVVLALAAAYGLDRAVANGVMSLLKGEGRSVASLQHASTWAYIGQFHWPVWAATGLLLLGGNFLRRRRQRPVNWHVMTCGLLGAGLAALVVALAVHVRDSLQNSVVSARNFYGVLSVFEYKDQRSDSNYYLLQHGRITHGIQFASPSRARTITSYFGSRSGLGLALRQFPRQKNQRVGLLGLGVGTVTAYGKPGDYFRIYEINPQVRDIAEKPFSYIARSDAKIELVMGDARLSMENEPPQNFDVLIMDAFSSDAVPVHLLTKEAFDIYQRHLKPDGAILVNISNRYLDLRPVVENAARALDYQVHHIDNEDGDEDEEDAAWWLYASSWMILSKNKEFMSRDALRYAASGPASPPKNIPLWTDDYTSMFNLLQ